MSARNQMSGLTPGDSPVLIFDDECPACSAVVQLVKDKAQHIRPYSIHGLAARRLLRAHFPDGWAFRPYLIVPGPADTRVLTGARLTLALAKLLGPAAAVRAARAWLRRWRRERTRKAWGTTTQTRLRAHVPKTPAQAAEFAEGPIVLPGATAGLTFQQIVQWHDYRGVAQTTSHWHHDRGPLVIEQAHRPAPQPAAQPGTLVLPRDGGCWVALRGAGFDAATLAEIAATLGSSGA